MEDRWVASLAVAGVEGAPWCFLYPEAGGVPPLATR
jgi:hypothetical protein